jgi:hypothetical protein
MVILLPETQLTEEDVTDELLPDIYVENSTTLLYEVKFFENFVIVRPATPTYYLAIRKLSHHEFASEFSEFFGDKEYVRDAIRGQAPMFVTEIA